MRFFPSLLPFCLACPGCVSKSSIDSAAAQVGPARKGAGASNALTRTADPLVWQLATSSPQPGGASDRLSFCGEADQALARVAARLARREALGGSPPDGLELSFLLRAEGEPHTWPHAWTLSGSLDPSDETARFRRYLDSLHEDGVRRCGIARSKNATGGETVAVVIVAALAELAPIATRARAGQWLRFDARVLVPATVATLVVLGPAGPPRSVPTTLHGDRVEATFAVERPGPFTVQLLTSTERGPRPVLEASVFVDVEAPAEWIPWSAPGEPESAHTKDAREALRAMVNAARTEEGVPALSRNDALDLGADEQARAMLAARVLSHDAGEGGPAERLRRLGAADTRAGENLAHEATAVRAHRALWWSPSHRGNLLDPRFTELGVGVAIDPDGSVWVCELFL